MKRIALFTLALLALAPPLWGATAKTPRELIYQYRVEGPFEMLSVPGPLRTTQPIVFVDSAATNASDSDDGVHGDTWYTPYATIGYAIDQLPSTGGLICVNSGHTETVDASTDIALDVADVTILGFGYGDDRPTITFAGADINDVHVPITGNNSGFINCRFVNGYEATDDSSATALVTMVVLAADYGFLRNCGFYEGGADGDANGTSAVTIGAGTADNDADFAEITDCEFYLPTTTNWAQAIDFAKDFKGVRITGNYIWGDFSEACIDIPAAANAQVGLVIEDCVLTNTETGDHALQANGTGNNGIVRWCTFCADSAYVDAGGLRVTDNVSEAYGTDSDTVGATLSLANDGITAAKIAADAIGATEIADGAIDAATFAAGAITAASIATDAIGAAELAADAATEIATASLAAIDANAVLNDAPRMLIVTTGAMGGGDYDTADSPVTLVDVTGTIKCRVVAVIDTALTSASNTGTLELGVVGDTACLLVQDQVDGTAFAENDCWTLAQAPDTPSAESASAWIVVPNGLDVDLTIATNNMTAGVITFYIEWIPLSADAAVADVAP